MIQYDNSIILLVNRIFDSIKYWFVNFDGSDKGVGSQLMICFFSIVATSLTIFGSSCAMLSTRISSKLTVLRVCSCSAEIFLLASYLWRGLSSSIAFGSIARTFFGNCFVEYYLNEWNSKKKPHKLVVYFNFKDFFFTKIERIKMLLLWWKPPFRTNLNIFFNILLISIIICFDNKFLMTFFHIYHHTISLIF